MLVSAVTFTDISVPNGDVSTTGWSATGTNDSSCASGTLCNYVDEGSTADTADYVQAPASGGGGELLTFDMENTFVGDGATELTFYVNARAINDANGAADTLDLRLSINGSDLATTSQPLTTSYTWYSVTYTGSWTQADIDSMQAKMTRQYQGGGNPNSRTDDTQVAATYVDITYEQSNTFEQSAYRWYENEDVASGWETEAVLWPQRRSHAMTTFNGKVWLVGGDDGAVTSNTYYSDVWSSDDGVNWDLVTDTAQFGERAMHTIAAFDNKLWIMGGFDSDYASGNERNDVWYSSDGETWTQATNSAGWAARFGHKTVVHNSKLWVMGGTTWDGTRLNDVWSSSDGVNWTQETGSAAWSGRRDLTVEVFNSKMWVYGGLDSGGIRLNDVWSSSDGVNWTQETGSAAWSGRSDHSSTVHNSKLWVLGGSTGSSTYANDVWSSSDGITWTQETATAPWTGRVEAMTVTHDNQMKLYGGGQGAGTVFLDGWFSSDGSNWTPDMWTPRRVRAASVVYNSKTWILGGFNGERASDVYSISDVSKATWQLETADAGWAGREGHTATVFDGKMWIMGGTNGSGTRYNDVWSTTDGINWIEETSNAAWGVRDGHTTLVYNNKLWVIGGYNGSSFFNDVWSSTDGVTWTQETQSSPFTNRSRHTSVIFNNKMWVIGGTNGTRIADVWSSSDGQTWTQETSAPGWSARDSHTSVVFDGKIWVVAGDDGSYLNDAWSSSDGINWATEPAGSWAERSYHTSVVFNNKLWVNGGYNGGFHGSVYSYTSPPDPVPLAVQDTAITAPSEGTPFRLRANTHVGVADLPADSATFKLQYAQQGADAVCDLSFTGENYIDVPDPGATVSGNWTEENGSAPWTARSGNELVDLNGTLYMFGGYGGTGEGYFNDVWSSTDGVNWTQETANAGWAARMDHSAVVYNNKIWLFGGFDGGTSYDDVWSSSDGQTWTLETDAPGWSVRSMHTSEVFNGKMWIIGGFNGSADLNDVWSSTDGVNWTQETASAGWTARSEHATFLLDNKMFISGGYNLRNDVWSTTDGVNWTQETAGASWSGRYEHTATTVNGTVWLMGGYNGSTHLNDVWTSTDGATWTQQSDAPWEPRGYFESILFDNKLWIQGGYDNPNRYNDTWSSPLEYPDISFHDNTNIADGVALSSSAEDPVHNSDTNVAQSYVESNTFTNPNAIPNGSDGVWDFSLIDNNAPGDTSYCFRIVNGDGSELTSYSSIAEITTQPPVLTQEDYRWFENQDKVPSFGAEGIVFRNPSTGTDAAYATAKDEEYLYTAGYYSANGNDWFVQKAKLDDGALCSAGACGTEFGGNGVVTINPSGGDDRIHSIAVDSTHIYVAGYDTAPGNVQWRIEKRDKNTGALDTNFGTNGVVTHNYGSLDDKAYSIAVHGEYIYVAGYEGIASGDTQGRVEKRNKTTGALCDGGVNCSEGQFATSGYYRFDNNAAEDNPRAITVDDSGVYFVADYNDTNILVRSLDRVNGSVLASSIYDPTAAQEDNPLFNAITTDDQSVYVGGQAGALGSDTQWWYAKHNKSDLNLCAAQACAAGEFATNGIGVHDPSTADDLATAISVDDTSIYLIGTDRSQDSGMSRYLMQKRNKTDGSLDTTFGTNGEVTYNPSTSHDEPRGMVIDNDYAWIVGYDAVPGNYEINTQKRKLSDGSLAGGEWQQDTTSASWSVRRDHTSVSYDGRLWVMGGASSTARSSDVWSSTDGSSWSEATSSAVWSDRSGHTSVVFDGKMWVIGGIDGTGNRNDVWSSTDGVTWTEETVSAGWSGRNGHTSVVHDGKIWVIGGYNGTTQLNDVWYSSDGVTWTEATSNAGWNIRSSHTSVVYDGKMWVMGGGGPSSATYNDVWSSTDGVTWTEETTAADWSIRISHASAVFDNKMWVFGGFYNGADYDEAWYSVDGIRWHLASRGDWSARIHHTAVEHENSLYLSGGTASGVFQNDVWSFDSSLVDVGAPLATENTPASLTPSIDSFRLRSLIAASQKTALTEDLKLQYSPKIGTCDTSFTGETYTDVSFLGGSSGLSAQTSGSSATNDGSSGSSWSGANDIYVSDDQRAQTSVNAAFGVTNSQKLLVTDFGFNIPNDAVVTGVEISIEGYKTTNQARITNHIYILGTSSSGKKSYIPNEGQASESVSTYGSSSDLWNNSSISPSEVNSASFGASLEIASMVDDSGTGDGFAALYADHMQIKVYYDTPDTSSQVAISYNDNLFAEDGSDFAVSANDPTNGNPLNTQKYVESNPTTLNNIFSGEAGLWDYSLQSKGGLGGSYCFRVVKNDDSLLDNYTYIPEIDIPPRPVQHLRHGRYFDVSEQARPFYW